MMVFVNESLAGDGDQTSRHGRGVVCVGRLCFLLATCRSLSPDRERPGVDYRQYPILCLKIPTDRKRARCRGRTRDEKSLRPTGKRKIGSADALPIDRCAVFSTLFATRIYGGDSQAKRTLTISSKQPGPASWDRERAGTGRHTSRCNGPSSWKGRGSRLSDFSLESIQPRRNE